jgi:hypothetical protein
MDTFVDSRLTNEVHILPFLKFKKNQTAVNVQHMGEPDSQLLNIAADFIASIKSSNEEGVAAAFKAAFNHLEKQPHEEISHESEEQE